MALYRKRTGTSKGIRTAYLTISQFEFEVLEEGKAGFVVNQGREEESSELPSYAQ